MKTEDKTES